MLKSKLSAVDFRDLAFLLDLTAMGMEAGLDFNLALDRAVRSSPSSEMAGAFQEALEQMSLGVRRSEAVETLSQRYPQRAFLGLKQAVILSEQLGGNLASSLRHLSQALQRERLAQAEARAQEIPVRLLAPLVFLIFPCVFIVLFAPIFDQLIRVGLF